MRADLPWLTACYGLTWDDIEAMSFGELAEYRRQLADVWRAAHQVEMVRVG